MSSPSSKATAGGGSGSSGSGKPLNKTAAGGGSAQEEEGEGGRGSPSTQQQQQQTVDLNTLTYPQLAQLKKQLDEEVSHLTTSYQQLRAAQNKFRDCLAAIRGAKLADAGEEEEEVGTSSTAAAAAATAAKTKPKTAVPSQEQSSTTPTTSSSSSSSSILVPLTTSLYVPGTLDNTAAGSSLLVDIGTGFFVSKTPVEALDFYNGKVDELGANLNKLDGLVQGKGKTVRVVEEALRQKVLASNAPGQDSTKPGDE